MPDFIAMLKDFFEFTLKNQGHLVTVYNLDSSSYDSYSNEESRTYDSGTQTTAVIGPLKKGGAEEMYLMLGKLNQEDLKAAFLADTTLNENSIILFRSHYFTVVEPLGIQKFRGNDLTVGYLVYLRRKPNQSLD